MPSRSIVYTCFIKYQISSDTYCFCFFFFLFLPKPITLLVFYPRISYPNNHNQINAEIQLTDRQSDHSLVRIWFDDDVIHDRSYRVVCLLGNMGSSNFPTLSRILTRHFVRSSYLTYFYSNKNWFYFKKEKKKEKGGKAINFNDKLLNDPREK